MPPKKILAAAIFVLAICLFSLCKAPNSEASPTPDKINRIIVQLENKLDKIISQATKAKEGISSSVTSSVEKFNKGKISRNKFCENLSGSQDNSEEARNKYNKAITKITQQKIKALQKVGANSSYINTAQDMGENAHDEKHALYDALDTEIDNAKKVPSPWCT